MSVEDRRRNSQGCCDLAIAELRRQAIRDGRAQPTPEEREEMLREMTR